MELTKKSKELLDLFSKNKCIKQNTSSDHTFDNILLEIYNDIHSAYSFRFGEIEKDTTNKRTGKFLPKISVSEINHVREIPYPTKFPISSFPEEIRQHINMTSKHRIDYTIKNYHRKEKEVSFHFILGDKQSTNPNKYISYAKHMLAWLDIVDEYSYKNCADKLDVYLYFTELQKGMPSSNMHVLGENNVNTAFTTTCPKTSEIVIFRAEEWFKVFMHETFHNFALDFSDMNTDVCHDKIRKIFDVESDVNLYEAYTETWAEIFNICFFSYHSLNHDLKNDAIYFPSHKDYVKKQKLFLKSVKSSLNIERGYSIFQMIKVLGFMGLSYEILISPKEDNQILRNTLYKEDSNILAYYVIKAIIMSNYKDFLIWCNTNNTSLLQFKSTQKNQLLFCDFIKKHYKQSSFLSQVSCFEEYTSELLEKHRKAKKKHTINSFLLNNLRMTIYELE